MRIKNSRNRNSFSRAFSLSHVQNHKRPLIIFGFISALFLLSLISEDINTRLKQSLNAVVTPIIETITRPFYAVRNGFDTVTELTTLRSENHILTEQNIELKKWHALAEQLINENKRLKSINNYAETIKHKYITARIIADTSTTFNHSFIAVLPEQHNITKGQAVLKDGYLIGRIIEVTDNTARILLVTDFNARIPVIIEGTDIKAIMAGNNNSTPELIHMPHGTIIENNASIVTSGHAGILPPNLRIGELNKFGQIHRVELGTNPNQSHLVQILQFQGINAKNTTEISKTTR